MHFAAVRIQNFKNIYIFLLNRLTVLTFPIFSFVLDLTARRHDLFLGAFAKHLRKPAVSRVMFSISSHGKTQIPSPGFARQFIFGHWRLSTHSHTLHMNTNVHLCLTMTGLYVWYSLCYLRGTVWDRIKSWCKISK